jgi:hypothetical protein
MFRKFKLFLAVLSIVAMPVGIALSSDIRTSGGTGGTGGSGCVPPASDFTAGDAITWASGGDCGANAALNTTGTTVTVTGILDADNLKLDGNTLSTTNTNGSLSLTPEGDGNVTLNTDTLSVIGGNNEVTRLSIRRVGSTDGNSALLDLDTSEASGGLDPNDRLGLIRFSGSGDGGSSVEEGARILAAASDTFTTTVSGTDLRLQVTPDSGNAVVTRFELSGDKTSLWTIDNTNGVKMTNAGKLQNNGSGSIEADAWQANTALSTGTASLTAGSVIADNLTLDANTLSSTSGQLNIAPEGANDIVLDTDTVYLETSDGDFTFRAANSVTTILDTDDDAGTTAYSFLRRGSDSKHIMTVSETGIFRLQVPHALTDGGDGVAMSAAGVLAAQQSGSIVADTTDCDDDYLLDGNSDCIATSTFSPAAGSSSITTVGTIGTGTWNATAIADDKIASASTWNAKQNALTFGIADTNAVKIDDSDAANNDYAKFTASGLEGRSYAEVKTDLTLDNVENTAISGWAGTSNITTVGTIGTGTWNATAIADDKIASASTWNAKQNALTFGIADTNAVKIDDSDAANNDYTKLTTSGLVGRSYAEVKTDLTLDNVENTAISGWAGTSNIITVGVLNGGSITTGFGAINNGSSTITTTGAITGGTLDINGASDVAGNLTLSGGARTITTTTDYNLTIDPAGTGLLTIKDSANLYVFGDGADGAMDLSAAPTSGNCAAKDDSLDWLTACSWDGGTSQCVCSFVKNSFLGADAVDTSNNVKRSAVYNFTSINVHKDYMLSLLATAWTDVVTPAGGNLVLRSRGDVTIAGTIGTEGAGSKGSLGGSYLNADSGAASHAAGQAGCTTAFQITASQSLGAKNAGGTAGGAANTNAVAGKNAMYAADSTALGDSSTYSARDGIFGNEIPIVSNSLVLHGAGAPKGAYSPAVTNCGAVNGTILSGAGYKSYGAGSGGGAYCSTDGNATTAGAGGAGGGGLAIYSGGNFTLKSGDDSNDALLITKGADGAGALSAGGGGGSILVVHGGTHTVGDAGNNEASINTSGGAAGTEPSDCRTGAAGGRGFYHSVQF